MFDDLRQVTITGGLTRDPELKYTNNGTAVLKLSVGSTESRKSQNGEYEKKSHYFEVTVWGKYAEMMEKKLSKGEKVLVTGDLDFQQWEQEGNKRSKLTIKASHVKPLSTNNQPNNGGYQGSNSYAGQSRGNNGGYQSTNGQSNNNNFESDIPF